MMTPQQWTKHAPGTYSVELPADGPEDYPDLIDIQELLDTSQLPGGAHDSKS